LLEKPMRHRKSSRSGWWTRYSQYLKSPEWKEKRQRLYRDRKGRCEDCGKKLGSGFHAHHKTYERVGNESLDDLALLCDTCHQKRHPNKRIGKKRKRRVNTSFLLIVLAAMFAALLLVTQL
jgi:5-methylcytosine-specific restriction endonuclease McrA